MRISLFCVLLFIAGCGTGKPAGVLSTEKMVDIITDLQLADAAYKLDMLPSSYKGSPQKYFVEVLANHQTDSATYNRSMLYYAEHPKSLKKIYTEVGKRLKKNNQQGSTKGSTINQ